MPAGTGASPNSARSTCDGVADAELHAEPDDTAMSLMPMSSESPSTPVEIDVQVVRQPMLERAVDDDAVELDRRPASRRSRSAAMRRLFLRHLRAARRAHARPSPTMPGTFERAGPQPALLSAAANQRRERPCASARTARRSPSGRTSCGR